MTVQSVNSQSGAESAATATDAVGPGTTVAGTTPTGPTGPGRAVLAACAATLLVMVTYAGPLVAVPALTADLGTGARGTTWLLSGISLGLGATLLAAGALADTYGRRRVLLAGTVALAVTEAAAAAAPTTGWLIAARIAQGVAGAALLVGALGVIAEAVPPGPTRRRATGWWGATLGAGILIGPLVTGLAVGHGGWRAGFWLVAVAAGVLTGALLLGLPAPARPRRLDPAATWTRRFDLVLAVRHGLPVPPTAHEDRARRFDVAGALTFGGGLTALLATVTEGRLGWGRPVVAALGLAAVALLVVFVVVQRRTAVPLLDLRLARHRPFLLAVLGALVTGLGVIALMSCLPTALHQRFGLDGLAAAGLLGGWSGTSVVVAVLARRLPARLAGRRQLTAGMAVTAAGTAGMLAVHLGGWPALLPGLIVAGIGSGLVNAALAELAVSSVPPTAAAMGSGANNTARYLGAAVGIALMVAVLGAPVDLDAGLLLATGFTAAGALATRLLADRPTA
jgi:MFS family permease